MTIENTEACKAWNQDYWFKGIKINFLHRVVCWTENTGCF